MCYTIDVLKGMGDGFPPLARTLYHKLTTYASMLRRKFMKKDTTMNACANCKYYKKSIFGKEQCTRQQIKTKAVHLCCDYEEKKK